jgi:hypothetical protein
MRDVEFRELMEEPPGGSNAGRSAASDPATDGRHIPLSVEDAQAHEFVQDGGWSMVETTRGSGGIGAQGAGDAGMTVHRGVLRGDEYVDRADLLVALESRLGFTINEVHSVYRQGRLSAEQGDFRARIDGRLLALSLAGANMLVLARTFGWELTASGGGDRCKTMERALARAREAERTAPICDRCGRDVPAVISPCPVCP